MASACGRCEMPSLFAFGERKDGAMATADQLVGKGEDMETERLRDELRRTINRYKGRIHLNEFFFSQKSLAQFFKLLVLFMVALIHLFYTSEYLEVSQGIEEFLEKAKIRSSSNLPSAVFLGHLLVDYKKNLYITVGSMCACLSASCFFLVLLKEECYKPTYLFVMRFVDTAIYLSIPALLWARLLLVRAIMTVSGDGIAEAATEASPAHMMDQLSCSVQQRENVPICSMLLERAIFPIVILEYLIALCLISAAYVLLSYAIIYCIKHWFPHAKQAGVSHVPCRGDYVPPTRNLLNRSYAPLSAEQLA